MAKDTVQIAQVPLCFIENKGQVFDQYGKPRADIQYKLEGKGITIFIGNGQLHYQFNKIKRPSFEVESYRIDIQLLGADEKAQLITEEPVAYFENYYLPQCRGGLTAHSFKKITYKNVYPFIDWVLYIKDDKLEYDFVVHEGGDVKNIQIKYKGNTTLVKTKGNVIAKSPMGKIAEEKLYAYEKETGKKIAAGFVVKHNQLSFDVAGYKGTLIIDPTLIWATYYGGTSNDDAYGVATDAAGNVFIAGTTASSAAIATSGSVYHSSFAGGSTDAFLVMLNASGVRQWASYYGGSGRDNAYGIACNDIGNIYITGITNSDTGIATAGAFQTSYGGGTFDAFLAKFDATGTLKWGTYFGKSGLDEALGIACDVSGNIYITGIAKSDSLATSGSFKQHCDTSDGFLAKFSYTGSRLWCTYYGGKKADAAVAVFCDGNNNVYITGNTTSSDSIASTGAHQITFNGGTVSGQDAFLAKFNSSGSRLWGTYYGGGGDENAGSVTSDYAGNVFISGSTESTNSIATSGSFRDTLKGTRDEYLIKFNPAGVRQWGTYYGTGLDRNNAGYGVVADSVGCVYLAGYTSDTTGIATSGTYQAVFGGGSWDAYLVKFTPGGQRLWGTYYGGSGNDLAHGVSSDIYNNVYIAGTTLSSSAIATSGSHQSVLGGSSDGFLAKFNTDTTVGIMQPYTDVTLCKGGTWNVHYIVNYSFRPGNTFTVQLSNASGSFTSPTAIGSASATNSGFVSCTIPTGTLITSGYRIRIVASAPFYISDPVENSITIITDLTAMRAHNNGPICLGDSLKLEADTIPAIANFYWHGPGGFISTLQNPIIYPVSITATGTYTVVASLTSCPMDSDITTPVIGTIIPAKPIANNNGPVCQGDTLKLTASSTTTGVSYSWTSTVGYVSNLQNPVRYPAIVGISGTYYVRAILNACKSAVDSTIVVVNPLLVPTVTISTSPVVVQAGDTVTYTANVINGGASPVFQWRKNGIDIPGATSNPYIINNLVNGDAISVLVHSNAPCAKPDSAKSTVYKVGINEIKRGISNIVFPNPNNGLFTIQLYEKQANGQIEIYNILGVLVYKSSVTNLLSQIDLRKESAGVYFLHIISGENTEIQKLIITH